MGASKDGLASGNSSLVRTHVVHRATSAHSTDEWNTNLVQFVKVDLLPRILRARLGG